MMPVKSKQSDSTRRQVPAVSRAITILEHLAASKEPLGVVPLAREIDIIPSTCLHILRALSEEGLVLVDPQTKQYSIGAGVLGLSRAYVRQNRFIPVTQAHLEDLSRRYGCSFAAVERSGTDEFIVVAIGDLQAGLSVRVSIGARFPVLESATGMCFAAFGSMSAKEISRCFALLDWESPIAFDEWQQEVEKTRKKGYAVDEGHFIIGTRIISVPVFRYNNEIIGCVVAVGLRERMQGQILTALIADLRAVAAECTQVLALEDKPLKAKARAKTS